MNRRKLLGAVAAAPVALTGSVARSQSPSVVIDEIYGHAPVQADGRIDGRVFYFRARGDEWEIEVSQNAKSADDYGDPVWEQGVWTYAEKYPGGEYAASWMEHDEARRLIHLAAEAYAKRA